MRILGIETSCDETSVAVVQDGRQVLSNVISSSKKLFESLAGVVPEEAARQQVEWVIPVLDRALEEAKLDWKDIDAIAVTKGPGLLGSLLVGTATARVLSSVFQKPLMGVHHTLGHLTSTWLLPNQADHPSTDPAFPVLTLSASGGHTDLWYRTSHMRGRLIGRTRDDAAGEAFDKGASVLGLPYPGGPSIAKAAEHGNVSAHAFPLPLSEEPTLDFSFSGLKTSLKYLLRDLGYESSPPTGKALDDISASYQEAICRHLLDRIERAAKRHQDIKEIHIVGGVSANTHLRTLATGLCASLKIHPILRTPASLAYCTDNAAMIASAGYFLFQESRDHAVDVFKTLASLPLEQTVLDE